MATTLTQEITTYNRLLPSLLGQIGKHVLIKGDENAGVFDTYEEALKVGYEKFGLDSFLVKKISPTEQVAFVTRFVTPCPA